MTTTSNSYSDLWPIAPLNATHISSDGEFFYRDAVGDWISAGKYGRGVCVYPHELQEIPARESELNRLADNNTEWYEGDDVYICDNGDTISEIAWEERRKIRIAAGLIHDEHCNKPEIPDSSNYPEGYQKAFQELGDGYRLLSIGESTLPTDEIFNGKSWEPWYSEPDTVEDGLIRRKIHIAEPEPEDDLPINNLPKYSDCKMRVENKKYLEKEYLIDDINATYDSKLPNAIHEFIYEYNCKDKISSAWFLHRLEKLIDFVKSEPKEQPQEWDGKGIPPVGIECEMTDGNSEFIEVEIIGNRDGFAIGWAKNPKSKHERCFYSDDHRDFRPIKSYEEKRRDDFIAESSRLFIEAIDGDETVWNGKGYGAIYDWLVSTNRLTEG